MDNMPDNFWKQHSELYAHVEVSGYPRCTINEVCSAGSMQDSPFLLFSSSFLFMQPQQNATHPESGNPHNNDTVSSVMQCHAQPKTSFWPSSSGDLRDDDSSLSSVLSPSSSLRTAVTQHDVRSSAAGRTWRNSLSGLPDYLHTNDPQLHTNTTSHGTSQFPTAPLHHHWVPQHDTLPQELPFNSGLSQVHCLWTNSQGRCNITASTVKSMLKHLSICHLEPHQPPASQVQCLFEGCSKTMRRDTILRHIREMHCGDKSRSQRPS
ncbi:uncharacterized protein EDB91DRAFT_91917 [Suillus paluster]|uniref:uncharacterized protein n=1 Tax=Suillus paluster TaxID=48578 RepID=UPI001B87EBA6|nr:uncharacterized protein EDB91DRAFT_91917 [Suillus paluster]KAG1725419.1 hypothetical protein EDB91DRAFT_91917 [Suillus paluster]